MEYKKLYSEEELNGLMDWFKAHMDQLPKSLYIDKATYVMDLKQTVLYYFDIINLLKEKPTYSAQIRHLFLMKEAIEREWNKSGSEPEE